MVLLWQAVIVITIALGGRRYRTVVAGAWAVWTIAMIFMPWLFVLQCASIAFGWWVADPPVRTPRPTARQRREWDAARAAYEAETKGSTGPKAASTRRAPAGWHDDPTNRFARRRHDGVRWTDEVRDERGHPHSDPL